MSGANFLMGVLARRRKWKSGAAGLVISLLLVGCIATGEDVNPEPIAGASADFDEQTGGIQGTVFDEELFPIADAEVGIPQLGGSVNTGVDGKFEFSFIQPGILVVSVAKPGYHGLTEKIRVDAGQITEVHLSLRHMSANDPYVMVVIRAGIIRCQATAIGPSVIECDPGGYTWLVENRRCWICTNISIGHRAVVAEFNWAQRASDLYSYTYVQPSGTARTTTLGYLKGPPPLKGIYLSGEKYGVSQIPDTYSEWRFSASTGYAGDNRRLYNDTFYPVCSLWSPSGGCNGIGTAVDLRYTWYISIFMNGLPPNLPEYTVIPDE